MSNGFAFDDITKPKFKTEYISRNHYGERQNVAVWWANKNT